ncbi:MAG: two component LuxR family transcriptional regulator [uncultured bacterium]|nr:MAG: two component LuxR family transcriptional regulator [uncultured bacterium]
MADEKITVVVVDNLPVVRHGVVSILHQSCNIGEIGESCGQAGPVIIKNLQPDVVILEIAMAEGGGRDCIAEIRKACPEVAIIIFSTDTNAERIMQAIKSGAKGYVLKTDPLEELPKAIQSCLRGELYFSPAVSAETMRAFLAGAIAPVSPLHCLTEREYEAARLFSDGKSTEEVAEKLFISPKTVRNHRKNIMGKLSCKHGNELLIKLHNFFHLQITTEEQGENSSGEKMP